MESWLRSDAPLPESRICPDCGERLSAGRRFRCNACSAAAMTACSEIKDRPIRPSDIAAIRARGEER